MQPMNGWNEVGARCSACVDGREQHGASRCHPRPTGCTVLTADADVDRRSDTRASTPATM